MAHATGAGDGEHDRGGTTAAAGQGTGGGRELRGSTYLVVFAGDGTAESTLAGELRARGRRVEAIDTRLGGAEHD
eukprot:125815-Pleurochrysis_carterae.AAC.1